MASVGTLTEAALQRKARLNALKHKQTDVEGDEEPSAKRAATDENEKLPRPVFRSYKPQDEDLKEAKLPDAQPAKVEEQVEEQLAASEPQPVVEEVDLINLAPRKPDWDLKRDVAKKLEKLEKRTQRAIAELIRERLQGGKGDLSAIASENVGPQNEDDEDE